MTNGIKIEWEEPGPADKVRLTVVHGSQHTVAYRDPTESDLTRALELLAPEVRGRVIEKWLMRVDSQEAGEEIRDLKNRLELSERQVTIATASAYAARSPDHIVAAMREMPADVLERVLAPFAHEKGKLLVERRAAEVRAEKAERVAFEQQLAVDDLRAKLEAAEKALADGRGLDLPCGWCWQVDHQGDWGIRDRAGKEIGCVIRRAADCYTWHGEGADHGRAPAELPARLALASSLREVFGPKLSTDDITAALWAMPGKERAVVLYPFWPAISEAAQRTHLADERATAAMADAAHYRLLMNDCRRVLTRAENERDDAASIRDILAAQAREIRSMILVGPDESVPEAVRRVLVQRDELRVKLAEATTHPRSFVCDEEMRAALFADCAAATRRGDALEKELAESKDTIATLERTRREIREAIDAPERLTTPAAARRLLAERDAAIAKLEAVRKAAG